MKHNKCRRLFLALVLLGFSFVEGLSASQVPGSVSGTVTEPSDGDHLIVGGKTYRLASTKPVEASLAGVHVGDVVQVWFNGPPTDATSQVISIENHSASRH